MGLLVKKGRRPHGLQETLGRLLVRLGASGPDLGPRARLRLDAGTGISLTATEDSTQDEVVVAVAGTPLTTNLETLIYSNTSVPAGSTVSNTTLEAAFPSKYTVPANTLAVGDCVRLTAYGIYGTKAAGPGTLQLRCYWQDGATATVMLDATAVTMTANVSGRGWKLDGMFIVQAAGSGGAPPNPIESQGKGQMNTSANAALMLDLPNAAPINADLTHAQLIYLSAQWSLADAANTITLRELVLEHLAAT